MRILQVSNCHGRGVPSGIHVVLDNEARLLRENGQEVRLFAAENDALAPMPQWRLALSLGPRLIWSLTTYRELRRLFDEWRPDVVHVHETFPQISPSVFSACRHAGIPVVQTIHNYRLLCPSGQLFRNAVPCHDCPERGLCHGLLHGCYRSRLHTLPIVAMLRLNRLRGVYRREVDKLLVLSQFSRDLLLDGGLPRELLAIKPNFCFDPGIGTPPSERRNLLFSGRLDEAKGAHVLSEAIRRVPKLPWVVAGSGPYAPLFAALPQEAVHYLGFLPHEALLKELGRARALVAPSLFYESGPMAVIEALAAGVPIIATTRGPLPELVRHEESGLLVPPDDTDALLAACRRIMSDDDLAYRLSQGARRLYEESFTPSANYRALISIYSQLTAPHLHS